MSEPCHTVCETYLWGDVFRGPAQGERASAVLQTLRKAEVVQADVPFPRDRQTLRLRVARPGGARGTVRREGGRDGDKQKKERGRTLRLRNAMLRACKYAIADATCGDNNGGN
jgi:hypothetical protein